MECGTVPVPVDWSEPTGDKIDIAVARSPAVEPRERIGTLFLLPGGPGIGGVDFVLYAVDSLEPEILRRFDVIGVDARGVGRSNPVMCPADSDPPSEFPPDAESYERLVRYHRTYADECRKQTGPVFDHVDTLSVARDTDAVRAALGERQISLYGESYGTLLGQQYAEEFPGRVRALVLDGNMDHSITDVRQNLVGGSTVLEQSYRQFAAWCDKSPRCTLRGQDALKVLDDLLARADRGELKDPAGSTITSEDLLETVRRPMYGPGSATGWASLATYLARLKSRNPVRAPGRIPEWYPDAYQAILCSDFSFPVRDFAHAQSLMAASRRVAPHTRVNALTWRDIIGCQGFLRQARNPQHPYRIKGTPPILLTNSRYDVATPHSRAVNVARQIPGSVLLTYDGISHVNYTQNACVTAAVNHYLLTLRTPRPDTRCPAEPVGAPGGQGRGTNTPPVQGPHARPTA
ncbi:MAG: alpha/beta fold hydrolase [Spirillospora sp.]